MTLVVSEKAAVASEPPERALGLPTALEADRSLSYPHLALRPKEASESTARGAPLGGSCTRLSAKITLKRGTFPSSCLSTDGADWASFSLAGCTTTARSSPNVSTITCRFRPVTCLFGSRPQPGPPWRSARADWVSITAALGLGSRPAATRAALRIRSHSR